RDATTRSTMSPGRGGRVSQRRGYSILKLAGERGGDNGRVVALLAQSSLETKTAARGMPAAAVSENLFSSTRRLLVCFFWCERDDFLEARIVPQRIEHRVEPEQRWSERHV